MNSVVTPWMLVLKSPKLGMQEKKEHFYLNRNRIRLIFGLCLQFESHGIQMKMSGRPLDICGSALKGCVFLFFKDFI